MTDTELQSLSDVFDGIFIGAIIFIVLLVVGYFIREMVLSFVANMYDYISDKIWLRKRNKHRKKCGLKPLKNKSE